ncbi:truncated peptidase M48 Ste24p [Aminobacter sp. Y103A]|nr:truncated peptidase M48 Ste24p [Aminobacter sp. SS-2016]
MSELQSINLFERRRNRALNTAQTWLLGAGSLLLLGVTAWAFAGSTGILYALVFGALSMWAVRRISPQMVLSMYKARQVTPADFPAGFRIVEELARRAELPAVPKLYVIPSKMMNAFAVGRRNDAAIAVTDALARNLTPREFAGVLAHEISHIAHEDVKVMAFADMVSRFTSFMSTVGLVSLFPICSVLPAVSAPRCPGSPCWCCLPHPPSAACCRWRCRAPASSTPILAPPSSPATRTASPRR